MKVLQGSGMLHERVIGAAVAVVVAVCAGLVACDTFGKPVADCKSDPEMAAFDENNALVSMSTFPASAMLDLADGCDARADIAKVEIVLSDGDAPGDEVTVQWDMTATPSPSLRQRWRAGRHHGIHVRLYDDSGSMIVEGEWKGELASGFEGAATWAWATDALLQRHLPHIWYDFAPDRCSDTSGAACCKLWVGLSPADLRGTDECYHPQQIEMQMSRGMTEEEAVDLVRTALGSFCGYETHLKGEPSSSGLPRRDQDLRLVIAFDEPGYLLGAIYRLWSVIGPGKFVNVGLLTSCLR